MRSYGPLKGVFLNRLEIPARRLGVCRMYKHTTKFSGSDSGAGDPKNATGTYNAVYILPRALYTNLTHTFIYFLATLIIEEKYESTNNKRYD